MSRRSMSPLSSTASARAFVAGLDFADAALLPGPAVASMAEGDEAAGSIARPALGSSAAALGVKPGVEQAFLVGSQIVSFNAAVTEARRAAALNSCLIAQLQATKLHGTPTTPGAVLEWHAAYVNTLINIGWVLQSGVTVRQAADTKGVAIDQVLLQVAGILLTGGAAAAAALAAKVIDAVAKAKKGDPFITLYNSRVVHQDVVDFGAALGSAVDGGFLLSVVECVIEVTSELQQVLVFKWESDSADVDGRRFDLSVSDTVYEAVRPLIEQKVLPHVRAFVSSLDI